MPNKKDELGDWDYRSNWLKALVVHVQCNVESMQKLNNRFP